MKPTTVEGKLAAIIVCGVVVVVVAFFLTWGIHKDFAPGAAHAAKASE